ncbi:MAG: MarR family winged helix-turn-helix transcriptional regulator [Thermoplasmata archaeon]
MEVNNLIEKYFKVKKIMAMIHRSVALEDSDMTLTDAVVFLKINTENEMTLGKLSELTGFSNTLITFTVDSLESKGLVSRTRGKDRRTILVTVTEKGREKYSTMKDSFNRNFSKLFSKLSDDEIERLMSDFDDIISIMEKVVSS